jgi:HlyD family secretion protein
MGKFFNYFLLIFMSLCLIGCNKSSNQSTKHTGLQHHIKTMVIEAKPNNIELFYKAKIEPLRETQVSSPTDAIVKELHFSYGQWIKKDQLLMVLESEQLNKDYNEALTAYLEAKENYHTQDIKSQGLEELWSIKAISKDEYIREKHQIASLYFTYLKAEQKIKELADKIHDHSLDRIRELNMDQIQKVAEAIHSNSGVIQILSPIDGIALLPKKTSNDSNSSESSKILVGSSVKNGDGLLAIGDLSGLALYINVNEININDIKPGQNVTITGVAFPSITLHGQVKEVEIQAKNSGGSGLPTFPVKIQVPSISSEDLKMIHMGMSAEIRLIIERPPSIKVPINALMQQGNITYAKLVDPSTEQIQQVEVVTGNTSMNDVTIVKGLKSGDKLVLPN